MCDCNTSLMQMSDCQYSGGLQDIARQAKWTLQTLQTRKTLMSPSGVSSQVLSCFHEQLLTEAAHLQAGVQPTQPAR